MPVCFCEIDTGRAFVVCGSFDLVHVSSSGKMAVCKIDDGNLGAVF